MEVPSVWVAGTPGADKDRGQTSPLESATADWTVYAIRSNSRIYHLVGEEDRQTVCGLQVAVLSGPGRLVQPFISQENDHRNLSSASIAQELRKLRPISPTSWSRGFSVQIESREIARIRTDLPSRTTLLCAQHIEKQGGPNAKLHFPTE